MAVLRDVSFRVQPGDVLAIVGPTGVGKTTLLRLMHGEIRPDSGEVWVDGRALHGHWRRGARVFRTRRRTGFVFQRHLLLPRLTAFENVLYALQVAQPDIPSATHRQSATAALLELGLKEEARRFPHELSQGEQQMVAVARALAGDPAVVLADEPTASLDEEQAHRVQQMLARAAAGGATVIVATHRLGFAPTYELDLARAARGR